jgi:hypothetical protein
VDHKPLTNAMSKTTEPWTDRQQRQLSYISEFTKDIQHVAGKSNVVADCLSRVLGAVQLNLDYSRMAVDQAAAPVRRFHRSAKACSPRQLETPRLQGGTQLISPR